MKMKSSKKKSLEGQFQEKIQKYLSDCFKDYEVICGEALLYGMQIDHEGNISPKNPLKPKRGQLAFQTDILIKKGGLPIVVCELKCKEDKNNPEKDGGFSTHEILIYSTKALKHKQIYPYLRYGFICGHTNVLSNKFFTHNEGFDFALAMPTKPGKASFEELFAIIKSQILNAELQLNMLKDKHQTVSFNTRLVIKNARSCSK